LGFIRDNLFFSLVEHQEDNKQTKNHNQTYVRGTYLCRHRQQFRKVAEKPPQYGRGGLGHWKYNKKTMRRKRTPERRSILSVTLLSSDWACPCFLQSLLL